MNKKISLTLVVLGAAFGCALLSVPGAAAPIPGNDDVFLSSGNDGASSAIEEYTPDGQHVRTINVPNNTGSYSGNGTEYLRGLAVNDAGQIVGFNGTFSPQLATFYPNTRTFTARTSPGWDIANNESSGSIGVYQGYAFAVSDNLNNAPAAIVRFNPDGTSQQFGAVSDYSKPYINLTVGLDGKLYVLYMTPGRGFLTDVYDPASLQLLRTITLQVTSAQGGNSSDLRSLTVDAAGSIYTADLYNYVYHLDANGNLLQSASHGHGGYTTDIKIDPASGRVLISVNTYGGVILQADASLSKFQTFIQLGPNDSSSNFIAFGNAKLNAALNGSSHVMWTNTDGRLSLWNQNAADGTFTFQNYGPFPGWTARATADGPDSQTRVLWDNTDGSASIWSLDNGTGTYTHHEFGPYPEWTARTLSAAPDNTTHVLWTKADGTASVWDYHTADGSFTFHDYGPYADMSARAVADGPDGLTRVLWDVAAPISPGGAAPTTPRGGMVLWSLDNTTGGYSPFTYGPYTEWTADAVSVGTDNVTHVLWNNSDGRASVWNQQPDGFGSFTQDTYGPYPNWYAKAIADGGDGRQRVLWDNTDGRMSLWNLDNAAGAFTQFTYGPYPGWIAGDVSSGY